MMLHCRHTFRRAGHTLMELVVAMVASAVLLAGLGSVMLIGSHVAYTPSAAARRTESADLVNQIADELRYATFVVQQTPHILDFIVADRNNDGAAERIRYEWSGTLGDPLNKTVNGAPALPVIKSVNAFAVAFQQTSKTTTLKTTADTAEAILISNTNSPVGWDRDISSTRYSAQQINPAAFTSPIPANALCWNLTKVQFYGDKNGSADETLVVQLRPTGDPDNSPSNVVLGERGIPEMLLSGGWNTATFANPVRGLTFHRRYALVWGGVGNGNAAELLYNDGTAGGVLESDDSSASWQLMPSRQLFYRLYGTYTVPSTSYNVTRTYLSHIELTIQSGTQAHSRVDASIPLANMPELLAAHWRADFNANPTTTDFNGDGVADWAVAGSGSFNAATLVNGVWQAAGALETRPLNDFATATFIDVRCRNTTLGGNGAVVRINADRQGGQHAPLLLYLQRQPDGTQTVLLLGKTSDLAVKVLFTRLQLPDGFIRLRLTILPQHNVVNLQINDEDQGAFAYPTYTPSSSTDRFLTLYRDVSSAEFDYIDVRVATN